VKDFVDNVNMNDITYHNSLFVANEPYSHFSKVHPAQCMVYPPVSMDAMDSH
jgi:hypothetical protein